MQKLRLAVVPLRFVLVALFAALVLFQFVIWPGTFSHMAEESPDRAHLEWPLVIVAGLVLLCAQVVIVCTWNLLTRVVDDRIFREESLAWADAIVASIAAAWLLLFGTFAYVTPQADDPGWPVLMMMLLLAGGGFGLLMVVMRALLRQATALRIAVDAGG